MPHYSKISTDSVEEAVRSRGSLPFSAPELGRELGVTRQTLYKHFERLRTRGWEIEGTPRLGFMARYREAS
jgi:biotin operon repressor